MAEKSDTETAHPPEGGELETYRAKRSADRTNEPFGADAPAPDATDVGVPRHFVIQKHAARRLHYDVRLQIGGVLRSWAVPRGPSLDPSVKRLAVMTEDHPLDYIHFEGVIPEGNYGAGAMIVWDRGVWVPLEPVAQGMRKGKLLFELRGHKLRGVWTLVRTQAKDGNDRQWLLIKKPDDAASSEGSNFEESSILSGLTVEELRGGEDRAKKIRGRIIGAAPRRTVDVREVSPMLAEPWDEAFDDERFVFELKYDGYRVLCGKDDEGVHLRYRSGRDATAAFPEVRRTLAALPFSRFVLDAEVVVLDDDARPNFSRLQRRALLQRNLDIERGMREHPVTLYVFDLLGFDDYDVRELPLLERKALLQEILPRSGSVRYAEHIPALGTRLMVEVRKLGIEGLVGKRADSSYRGGRSDHWRKIRIEHTEDFVIVGFTRPQGSRVGLGALHLAAYVGEELRYAGRVGTGFSHDDLRRLQGLLEARAIEAPPLPQDTPVPRGSGHVWVAPEQVAEVRYKHVTEDGMLRHPVFERLRPDKPPQACAFPGLDVPAPVEVEAPAPAPALGRAPDDAVGRVTLTNPQKLFWPQEGYTKRDLFEYYRGVAPWLLPYLRERPLVLTRYPDGIDGKSFYQKNAPPHIPDWIRTRTMWSEHAEREIHYFVCDDLDALLYVANLATIPLHVWGSQLQSLQHPDWAILDLDPKEAPFSDVVTIALHIHDLCQRIGLPNYIKTSGSTGLHVLIPLGRQCTFEQCRMLSQLIAQVTVSALPEIATVHRAMRARQGRVYIDYLQNGHGRLLVSPLCVRPRPGATVSMPLRWSEVGPSLDPAAFNIRTAAARMERLGEDPFSPVLHQKPDLQRALDALLALLQ